MRYMSRAVTLLLAANIVLFVLGYLLPNGEEKLQTFGAIWYPANPNFQPWQVVSYMFLHGGPSHLFFNMFALVSFGTILEREWGSARFLAFYFLCGVGAGLVHEAVNWHQYHGLHERLVAAGLTPSELSSILTTENGALPPEPAVRAMIFELFGIYASPMVGASGAIYGLLVAFGMLHPNARLALMFLPVPIAAKFFIPIILFIDLFSGVTGVSIFGAGIAHFAHVGGGVIGFLLMLLWRNRRREPDWMVPVAEDGTIR